MKNKGKTENGKGKKLVEIYELDMEGRYQVMEDMMKGYGK